MGEKSGEKYFLSFEEGVKSLNRKTSKVKKYFFILYSPHQIKQHSS